ncbi:MAG TPA: hypothetical protein VFQ95_02360 [Rhodanobacteraceae bacterium]|nr:hypothetical protein [Rhodanobacteraceae bacterium]
MVRFIGLLLIGPWLIVLGFLYWLYARRRAANGVPAHFDVGVLIVAALSTIVFSALAFDAGARAAMRANVDPVWKQMAAAWAAYPAYFIVLFLGLLRHWIAGWLLRRKGHTGASQT